MQTSTSWCSERFYMGQNAVFYRHIFQVVKDKDKNHRNLNRAADDQNLKGGPVPWFDVTPTFNPARFLKLYLSLLPLAPKLTDKPWGFLFPRSRRGKLFDLHSLETKDFFETHQKGSETFSLFSYNSIYIGWEKHDRRVLAQAVQGIESSQGYQPPLEGLHDCGDEASRNQLA